MKLKFVEIKNFRSIEKESFYFDPLCKILVGINESGKSNLLRALSFLSPEINPSKEDKRESLPNESPIDEAYVDFIFEAEISETENIFKRLFETEIFTSKKDEPIIKSKSTSYSIKQFCEYRNKAVYRVNIISGKKAVLFYTIDKELQVLPNWMKHSTYKKVEGEKTKSINNCLLINSNEIKDEEKPNLTEITIEDINNLVNNEVKKLVIENIPETILWEYKKENDLPPSVVIDTFKVKPDSCVPLKNMFLLAGITDINKSITDAQQGTPNQFRNLLEKVADHTTNYIKSVWQDYKSINITLEPNGENIDIYVKEKNRFSFYQRSDGFKRFVTFILMISTVVTNKHLTNFLLLIDEPEIHIHPSGIRYLRKELIKISQKGNIVVVSTHSIFMIDSERIKSHYIVKKNNEKTNLIIPDEGNLAEEEVLYNAFGISIFDSFSSKNIIFEGWRDKQMFRIAIDNLPLGYKTLKDKFKKIGFCHVKGVNQIKNITPLLELGSRECLILSDNDEPAKRNQTEYNKLKGYGIWKRYDEVDSTITAITGEDFVKDSSINKAIDKVKSNHSKITSLPNPSLTHIKGKIFMIDRWLKQSGYNDDEERKEILSQIKDAIFIQLKTNDIESFYFDYLKEVSKLL